MYECECLAYSSAVNDDADGYAYVCVCEACGMVCVSEGATGKAACIVMGTEAAVYVVANGTCFRG